VRFSWHIEIHCGGAGFNRGFHSTSQAPANLPLDTSTRIFFAFCPGPTSREALSTDGNSPHHELRCSLGIWQAGVAWMRPSIVDDGKARLATECAQRSTTDAGDLQGRIALVTGEAQGPGRVCQGASASGASGAAGDGGVAGGIHRILPPLPEMWRREVHRYAATPCAGILRAQIGQATATSPGDINERSATLSTKSWEVRCNLVSFAPAPRIEWFVRAARSSTELPWYCRFRGCHSNKDRPGNWRCSA